MSQIWGAFLRGINLGNRRMKMAELKDCLEARHVLMFDQPLPEGIVLDSLPGNTEILRIDPREIYIAAYRQPDGRYTEHVEEVLKPLYARIGKTNLDTMRNWNTIEKIL